MSCSEIIALIISGIGLVISIIALLQSKKANNEAKNANKAAMRQNLEQELARIETDIRNNEARQEDAKRRGQAETQHIYGCNVPNPYSGVIQSLEVNKQNLQDRKAEIIRQLQQL